MVGDMPPFCNPPLLRVDYEVLELLQVEAARTAQRSFPPPDEGGLMFRTLVICGTRKGQYVLPTQDQLDDLVAWMGCPPQWYPQAEAPDDMRARSDARYYKGVVAQLFGRDSYVWREFEY